LLDHRAALVIQEAIVAIATAPASTVTRAVLIDRLSGLLYDRRKPNSPSRLQNRLDEVLDELITGVSRSTGGDESLVQHGVERALYAALLDGIEAEGLAVPEQGPSTVHGTVEA
jgi:hypothetical protein